MADSGIQLNGRFSNFLGVVAAGLLLASVAGIWAMYGRLGVVETKVDTLKERMDNVEQIVIYRGPEFNGGR